MKWLLPIGLALVASLAFVACGGGGGKDDSADKAAIETLIKDLGTALEQKDPAALLSVFVSTCPYLEQTVNAGVASIQSLDVKVTLEGVDVRNLANDKAEALAKGTISVNGQESRLEGDNDYIAVAKENGDWKISDCTFLGGA